MQAHFEGEQFSRTKKGHLILKTDAVPTIFVHRPEPKRRKGPAVRSTTEPPVHAVASDHTYCPKMNFGMNNVKSNFNISYYND